MRRLLPGALGIWFLFGLCCATDSWWAVHTHGHSALAIYSVTIAAWLAWALATPLVAWLGAKVRIYPFTAKGLVFHTTMAFAFGAVHELWWSALRVWFRPWDGMSPTSISAAWVKGLNWYLEVTIYFAVLGVTWALESQRVLREREMAAAKLEASLAQARLHALELQLQPHFLFNTLHAIGGLVRQSRSAEAVEMIAGLSDLLRYALERAGELVRLDREVAILRRYLDIQRIRFPDRLTVEFDVADGLGDALVPGLILQPLAENAVRHGIETLEAGGSVRFIAMRQGDQLVLRLINTGQLVAEHGGGVGLTNTRARLEQLRGTFSLTGEQNAVVATLTIPWTVAATNPAPTAEAASLVEALA